MELASFAIELVVAAVSFAQGQGYRAATRTDLMVCGHREAVVEICLFRTTGHLISLVDAHKRSVWTPRL